MLNTDFFEELKKKDEGDICNHFGNRVGKQMIKQSILEERFLTVCVEDGVKMTPLDDEFITEEARQCALDLKDNTMKIMRAFTDREMQLKLTSFLKMQSSEFAAFNDSFHCMQRLYTVKLNTPQEEVKSIKANLTLLKEKITKLEHQRTVKKDAYDKYCEECSKSKEIRDN
jgi:hypothetical protein